MGSYGYVFWMHVADRIYFFRCSQGQDIFSVDFWMHRNDMWLWWMMVKLSHIHFFANIIFKLSHIHIIMWLCSNDAPFIRINYKDLTSMSLVRICRALPSRSTIQSYKWRQVFDISPADFLANSKHANMTFHKAPEQHVNHHEPPITSNQIQNDQTKGHFLF